MYSQLKVYLLCLWLCVNLTEGQTLNDSVDLMNNLLSGYDKRHRPLNDQTQPLSVNVSLEILTVQDVDEVGEKFTISGLMSLAWFDQVLTWTPSDHGKVDSLMFPITDIWYPELVLTNPYAQLGGLAASWMKSRVYSDGWVTFMPGKVFQATCPMDVTYYPFDTQMCKLAFTSWPYDDTEIILVPTFDEVQKNYYSKNGEWSIAGTSVNQLFSPGKGNIVFEFKLMRQPMFVLVNVILPIIFMAVINLLVFLLPSDSGERVGYAVTVLLTLAVFLTLVGDNLPKTSEPMPILCAYLTSILIVSLLMCLMTIVSLNMYHKNETQSPSKPLQIFAKLLLCRICTNNRNKCTPEENSAVQKYEKNSVDMQLSNDSYERDDTDIDMTTWKDVSRALDMLCLCVFIVAVVLVNAIYITTLMAGDTM